MAAPSITVLPEQTINTFLSKWNASNLPIQYVINNDKYPVGATVSNYYTEVLIYVNGSLVATVKQIPDSDNNTKVDIQKYVRSVLSYVYTNGGKDSNAFCEFYITGSENYLDSSGVAQSNAITGGGSGVVHYGCLAALQFGASYGGNMYDYILDSSKLDTANWMTFFERGQLIDNTSYLLSVIVNDPGFDLEVIQYDINGIELLSEVIAIDNDGIGLYRLNLANVTFDDSVSYLTVQILTSVYGTALSELFIIDTDFTCLSIVAAPVLSAVQGSDIGEIDLSWSSIEGATYDIYRSTSSGGTFSLISSNEAGLTYTDTLLDDGTDYFYKIKSKVDGVSSSFSNEATATTIDVFSFVVDTTKAGSASDTFIMPTESGKTYNANVDWGDSSQDLGITTYNDALWTHQYSSGGTYTIKMWGTFTGFKFNNTADKLKITNVTRWGVFSQVESDKIFYGCSNITALTPSDALTLINGTRMFSNSGLTSCTNINDWDVSATVLMSNMFENTSINQDISGWDVGLVENFTSFMNGNTSFNQDIDIWNISSATNLQYMFSGATSFNKPLNSWDVSNVTTFLYMFNGATSFNQNLNSWTLKASGTIVLTGMFKSCTVFNGNITSWAVQNVSSMDEMFQSAAAFNQNIGGWTTTALTRMDEMFYGATIFNQDIGSWDVDSVTLFKNCFRNSAFNQDISSWVVSAGTLFDGMFQGNTAFNQNISSWTTTACTNISNMFNGATAFNQNISSWNMASVTTMTGTFQNATIFNQDLSSWNYGNVTSMTDWANGAALSNANWSSILIQIEATNANNNYALHGGAAKYTAGAAATARAALIADHTVTITDGGAA